MFDYTFLDTQFGRMCLVVRKDALCRLYFPKEKPMIAEKAEYAEANLKKHAMLKEACSQVLAYLRGTLRVFDLPLDIGGTSFQLSIWEQLCAIPYGQTKTYGEVAGLLGGRQKARAVGRAAHVNPIPLIIPCHRLIGTGGALVGFGGGLPLKRALLDLEQGKPQSSRTTYALQRPA